MSVDNKLKRIDLSSLVDEEKYGFIDFIDGNKHLVTNATIRGIDINYYTNNKRLLWIALGLEYIEPELLDWIDNIPKDSVLYDIGASNGPFSIYSALKDIRVVAFEPEAQNYALLEMNHYLNNQKIKHPIISLNIAVSNSNEIGKIHCAKYEGGGHVKILDKTITVDEKKEFTPVHSQYVIKYKLDNLIEKYNLVEPQYLKIDVDGAEWEVVEGAENTLIGGNIKGIFIELMNPESESEGGKIIKKLSEYGYKLKEMHQVQRYEGLYNCIFEIDN